MHSKSRKRKLLVSFPNIAEGWSADLSLVSDWMTMRAAESRESAAVTIFDAAAWSQQSWFEFQLPNDSTIIYFALSLEQTKALGWFQEKEEPSSE